MGSEKKIIYTADFGDYDDRKPLATELKRGWEALYFTDNPERVPEGWFPRYVDPKIFGGLPNVAIAKCLKINPQYWLSEHDVSLWVDGNRTVLRPLNDFESRFANDFVSMTHPNTRYADLYYELERCKKHRRKYIKDVVRQLEDQQRMYKKEGIKGKDGFDCENGILYRRNVPQVWVINLLWWAEFMRWKNWRDQVALRYILQKYGLTIKFVDRGVVSRREDEDLYKNPFFWLGLHKEN